MLTASWQAVATTAGTLVDFDFEYEVRLRQVGGSGFVWLGGPDVAENNGFRLPINVDTVIRVQGDAIHAVASGETCTVQILAYSV